jgi:hypothetical protein
MNSKPLYFEGVKRYEDKLGRAQGREKEVMLKYTKIPGVKADVCSTCSGHCETACSYNVPIQGKLLLAHTQLTML